MLMKMKKPHFQEASLSENFMISDIPLFCSECYYASSQGQTDALGFCD